MSKSVRSCTKRKNLFVAQRNDRIYGSSASGRNVARSKRNHADAERGSGEHTNVRGANSYQHSFQQSIQRQRANDPGGDSGAGQPQALAKDHAKYLSSRSSQSHTHANFLRSLSN